MTQVDHLNWQMLLQHSWVLYNLYILYIYINWQIFLKLSRILYNILYYLYIFYIWKWKDVYISFTPADTTIHASWANLCRSHTWVFRGHSSSSFLPSVVFAFATLQSIGPHATLILGLRNASWRNHPQGPNGQV